jgi:hypothetical protein
MKKQNHILQVKGNSLLKYQIKDGDYVIVSDKVSKDTKTLLCIAEKENGIMSIVECKEGLKINGYVIGIVRNY